MSARLGTGGAAPDMIVGLDASNLRAKGGLTHLKGMIGAAEPQAHGIDEVIVWAAEETLEHLPERSWLRPSYEPALDGPLPCRLLWQFWTLDRLADRYCDLLFVPGGNYTGRFRPFVAMSRNMLSFCPAERRRYGFSWNRLRLILLKRAKTTTFRRADGMIFLTRWAKRRVLARTGELPGKAVVIPHGVSRDFVRPPRIQKPLSAFNEEKPFRWLYVSSIDPYKHQWQVVKAVGRLRQKGLPMTLDLIGPERPPRRHALERLKEAIERIDPDGRFVERHGFVPHDELAGHYHKADAFVFASSCENMPNTLLEAMSAGLPIASSRFGPMPEVLSAKAGVYFDPERIRSIETAMQRLVEDAQLRARLAREAFERAEQFSWELCAAETFEFLASIGD